MTNLSGNRKPIPNIILFGATGSGKSSIVNMISNCRPGRSRAKISNGMASCTFKSERFLCNIKGTFVNIHDTAGLDEGEEGGVPNENAIIQLYQLMRCLNNGVSLLVYCMRAPRMQESAQRNWSLFYEVFCKEKVPIVVVVTGLEHEEPSMDSWWVENKGQFQKNGMRYSGFACITAIRGKRMRNGTYGFQEEYLESQETVQNLILHHYLVEPWKMEGLDWFAHVTQFWCGARKRVAGPALKALVAKCGMSEEDATKLAEKLKESECAE